MLPFVLGGIALAAVGYGVKEFCESEGCPEEFGEDTGSLWEAEIDPERFASSVEQSDDQSGEVPAAQMLSATKEALLRELSREIDVAFDTLDILLERAVEDQKGGR
jgi:hypothetical protein